MLHFEPLIRWIDPSDLDLFQFWRWLLALACTIYAVIVSTRSLFGWMVFLSGAELPHVVMRRYVIVQLLRLRISNFVGDLLWITGLSGVFVFLVYAHRWVPH